MTIDNKLSCNDFKIKKKKTVKLHIFAFITQYIQIPFFIKFYVV